MSTPFRAIVRSIDISVFNGSTNLLLVRSGPFNSARNEERCHPALRRQKRDNCICYSLHRGQCLLLNDNSSEQIWLGDLRWWRQRRGVIISPFQVVHLATCRIYNFWYNISRFSQFFFNNLDLNLSYKSRCVFT